MFEDDSFGRDYNNQYGYIGDTFSQNNDADENYIYYFFYLFIYTLRIKSFHLYFYESFIMKQKRNII